MDKKGTTTTVFGVEGEDGLSVPISWNNSSSDESTDGHTTRHGERDSLNFGPNESRVDCKKTAMKDSNIHSDNAIKLFDESDIQMNDGFDEFLTQIDENFMQEKNIVRSIENQMPPPPPPSDSLRKSDTTVTSSFFASQDIYNGGPPIKRRFPGPAGILPQIQREQIRLINKTDPFINPLYEKISRVIAENSQNQTSATAISNEKGISKGALISKAPWKSLIANFNLNINDKNDLLNTININWIRLKAKRFPEEIRIPFLAAVVQEELEVAPAKKFRHKNPSVKLIDPSGTILAAFNPNFVEAFGNKMVPGTALALRNCAVLRLKKSVLLKVAKKNLLAIASLEEEVSDNEPNNGRTSHSEIYPHTMRTGNNVVVMQTAPFQLKDIMEEITSVCGKLNASKLNTPDIPENFSRLNNSGVDKFRSTSLFSSVCSNTNDSHSISLTKPFAPPFLKPSESYIHARTTVSSSSSAMLNNTNDSVSCFDDDDDEELLQALQNVDFIIDEDSM